MVDFGITLLLQLFYSEELFVTFSTLSILALLCLPLNADKGFYENNLQALGDYTRTISDFSTFPSAPKEGRVGAFWYHEDTQAFFDDLDQYRMIKAMCRLSCSVCDKAEDQPREGGPRHHRQRIKSVEQLKGHLYHKHKLHMCGLCLEGRKVGASKLHMCRLLAIIFSEVLLIGLHLCVSLYIDRYSYVNKSCILEHN